MDQSSIPHIRKTKKSCQLVVKGRPFLMLAGELHNSSLSSAAYMDTVWANMKAMNINTLLGAVYWETIEPEEAQFDFSELEKVILAARRHDLHLVLLWFGSYKNAMSSYAPPWVKKDVRRFPRVHISEAGAVTRTLEVLSPFNERAWKADAKAFATLMGHLKAFDEKENTVLMVQVENETGLLGDSRDRSRVANELFTKAVPQDLIHHLQSKVAAQTIHPSFTKRFPNFETATTTGSAVTWTDAFGTGVDADEMFMADAFSRYVGHVAAAGREAYPIPHFTNAWMNFEDPDSLDLGELQSIPAVVGGGGKPGVYPSGGPLAHTLDVWQCNAPALSFISPDLYLQDYETICKQYTHQDQPLFIPEQRRDERGMRRVWLAYGSYQCIGCGPFGVDTLEPSLSPLTKHYGLLQSISKHILEAQAERPEDIMGFYFDEYSPTSPDQRSWTRTFGEFIVTIDRAFVFGTPGPGSGLIIHRGDGRFLCAGWGFDVSFKSANPEATFTGVLHAEEKKVECNELVTERILGGDETRSGRALTMPNEDPDYGGFPIAVTIPSRTMIAEVWAYSVFERDEDC